MTPCSTQDHHDGPPEWGFSACCPASRHRHRGLFAALPQRRGGRRRRRRVDVARGRRGAAGPGDLDADLDAAGGSAISAGAETDGGATETWSRFFPKYNGLPSGYD